MSPAASPHAGHDHGRRELVAVARREDPTRTQTVRRRYAQALRAGYQSLNTLIREFVGQRDVLGLSDSDDALTAARPPPNLVFARDDEKIEAFRDWLEQAQREDVLEVVGRGENRYVRQAYETGARSANTDIRQAGVGAPSTDAAATLRLPVHERTLQRLYTRNFSELQGLTDDVGRQVARELSESLAEGVGPRDAARRITDVLGSIEDGTPHGAQARATTIARTEIMRARHLGAQEQYQRHGVRLVEPLLSPTACPECVAIAADAPYRVEQITSIWPVHPNCRCSTAIYTTDAEVAASARASAFAVPVERAEAFAVAEVPMTPGRHHANAA